ncbi:MAG: phosphoribosylformylglycinamidine synthase subunit PurS [Candidatus Thermoplasmatota archaeon]
MFQARIKIGLKKGISDPEGANTLKALQLLGFKNVKEAETFKIVDLTIDENDEEKVKESVEEMCERLLTNPVIHDYMIEINKI